MKIFDAISKYGHEQMVLCHERATGLRAVIAIHNTICGPALGGSGDPSPFTSLGTYEGIRASVKYHLKKDSLKGIRVAIQGVGHVGYYLCEMLHESGAELIVTDIFEDKVEKVFFMP